MFKMIKDWFTVNKPEDILKQPEKKPKASKAKPKKTATKKTATKKTPKV